jgi:hypothetical protein
VTDILQPAGLEATSNENGVTDIHTLSTESRQQMAEVFDNFDGNILSRTNFMKNQFEEKAITIQLCHFHCIVFPAQFQYKPFSVC